MMYVVSSATITCASIHSFKDFICFLRLYLPVVNHVFPLIFQLLQSLGAPHVESFNYMLREGLDEAVNDILAVEFSLFNDDRFSIKFEVCQF
jgi:hypothetical protein